MIVKEFMIGNTKIKIADDYCKDKTPEDVERILAKIARDAQRSLTAAAIAKEKAAATSVDESA